MTVPNDAAGPLRAVDVVPMPAVVNVIPVDALVDGKPGTVLRLEVITPAGSAFAHLTAEQAIEFAVNVSNTAKQAKSGLVTPPPGFIIPGGANGQRPG